MHRKHLPAVHGFVLRLKEALLYLLSFFFEKMEKKKVFSLQRETFFAEKHAKNTLFRQILD